MGMPSKLKNELVALVLGWFFFALWFGLLMVLKKLTLSEYQIEFKGLSVVLVSALVLAKVVLIMEHAPLGLVGRPAWMDVVLRTLLYTLGVIVVLVLEKGLEGRHEHGGFTGAVQYAAQHAQASHVWIDALAATSALFAYNVLSVVRHHLGPGGLLRLFVMPMLPEAPVDKGA
jgi:hypothetical protein